MADGDDDIKLSSSSLETPRPLNDDASSSSLQEVHSEAMYAANGCTLKALAILSIGLLHDDGSAIFNPSVLPWSAALRPSALKLTAKDLRAEVERHCEKSCVVGFTPANAPRPNQWTISKATEWLIESNCW